MQSWAEITREERYFCSFLFHDVRKNKRLFLQLLADGAMNEEAKTTFIGSDDPDVGYEVCLFRDALKHGLIEPYTKLLEIHGPYLETKDYYMRVYKGMEGKKINLIKQTFDFALWLKNNAMVIIEAKAHEGLSTKQVDYLEISRDLIERSHLYPVMKVYIGALVSSHYRCTIKERFDFYITWDEVASIRSYCTNKSVYDRANNLYGRVGQ